jgi:hypothetical protein
MWSWLDDFVFPYGAYDFVGKFQFAQNVQRPVYFEMPRAIL